MARTPDQHREDLGMSSWTDSQLVKVLAKRFTEQSVVTQLMTVSAEEGAAFGIELLLRNEVPGEGSTEMERDGVLDAMITEARHRIAVRVEQREYIING